MRRFLPVLALAAAPLRAQSSPGRKWNTIERIEPAHLSAVHEARERFAAAKAALASGHAKVVYTPGQDHITGIVNVTAAGDLTARTILDLAQAP